MDSEDEGGNDAQSVHSPSDSEGDELSDLDGSVDGDGHDDHELHKPEEVQPESGAQGDPTPCSTHDTDVDDDCSECQDGQAAQVYEQQFAGMQPEIPEDESPDGIPTLLSRHTRTDERRQTLSLEQEVLMLAQQRLGEGQYENASKFAKLIDKVDLRNSYLLYKGLMLFVITEAATGRHSPQNLISNQSGAIADDSTGQGEVQIHLYPGKRAL